MVLFYVISRLLRILSVSPLETWTLHLSGAVEGCCSPPVEADHGSPLLIHSHRELDSATAATDLSALLDVLGWSPRALRNFCSDADGNPLVPTSMANSVAFHPFLLALSTKS